MAEKNDQNKKKLTNPVQLSGGSITPKPADVKNLQRSKDILQEYLDLYKDIEITSKQHLKILEAIEKGEIKTVTAMQKKAHAAEKENAFAKVRKDILDEQNNLLDVQVSLADQIQDRQTALRDATKDIFNTSTDHVKELYKQHDAIAANLKREIERGDLEGESLALAKQNLVNLQSQNEELAQMADIMGKPEFQAMQTQFEFANDRAKALGDTVDGIFDNIPAGGFLQKALGFDKVSEKAQEEVRKSFQDRIDQMKGMEGEQDKLNTKVKSGSTNWKLWAVGIVAAGAALWGIMSKIEDMGNKRSEQNSQMAKANNLSYAQGKQMLDNIRDRSNKSDQLLANTQDIADVQSQMIEQLGPMGDAMGGNAEANAEAAAAAADTAKAYGYTLESAGQIQSTLVSMGMTSKESADYQMEIAAEATKQYVSAGKVMEDIAKNSRLTTKYLAGNAKGLKDAAIQAAKMNLSLSNMVDIADGLLSIENSLTAQYEFQALSGKQVNLDKARQLALDGKLAEAAKEMGDQLRQQGIDYEAFGKMRVHEKEALAKMMNMEVGDVEKMLAMDKMRGKLSKEEMAKAMKLGMTAEELSKMDAKSLKNKIAEADTLAQQKKKQEELQEELENKMMPVYEAIMKIKLAILDAATGLVDTLKGGNGETARWLTILGLVAVAAGGIYLLWRRFQKTQVANARNTKERLQLENESMNATKTIAENAESQTQAQQETATATKSMATALQEVAASLATMLETLKGAKEQTDPIKDNIQATSEAAASINENLSGGADQADTMVDKTEEMKENAEATADATKEAVENMQEASGVDVNAPGGGSGGFGASLKGIGGSLVDSAKGFAGLGGGGNAGETVSNILNSDMGGMIKSQAFGGIMGAMGVGDLAIDPNGGPVVTSPREGGIYQGTKNDGVSMSPSHGGSGGGGAAIDYQAMGAAVAAAIAANPPQVNMDGKRVSENVTENQSNNKGRG